MGSYWKAVKNGKYRDMKHSNELLGLLVTNRGAQGSAPGQEEHERQGRPR